MKHIFIKIKDFLILQRQKILRPKPFIDSLLEDTSPFNDTAQTRFLAFSRRKLYFTLSLVAVFLIVYAMLFFCFPPNIIFSNTTTNGGDMGAHNYIAKFFIEQLFPNLRMTGWDMGWFAGMPMLTFYFPLPYFFIAILSKIAGYNIAFKFITILGSLMLPAGIYYFGKLFRFKYPFPELAAVGAMAFLYMKSFKIYGANFLGTFAGEFSYSISFGLIFFFLATLYRGIEREKFDWVFAVNCLLLAGIVLTHLITLIAILIIAPSLFFIRRNWKCARYIIMVFIVGFFLSAFWSLPFVLLIKWTPTMNWTNIKNLKELFPLEIIPAMVLAVVGLFFSTLRRDKRMVPATWTVIVLMSILFTWDGGRLYNARFLPFIFVFIYLIAAYGMSHLYWLLAARYPLVRRFTVRRLEVKAVADGTAYLNYEFEQNSFGSEYGIGRVTFWPPSQGAEENAGAKISNKKPGLFISGRFRKGFYKFLIIAFVPVVAFIAGAAILAGNPLGPAWARHNYTGFESKPDWQEYENLMKYLDTLPYGRVMFEFDKAIMQKYGTPRSFELIPFWTDQAGMEGLLVESSLTAPFHYINQAELSVKPRGTVAGWKVPSRNYDNAIKHLMYMNISYIMASSPEVIADLDSDSRVVFLNKVEPYYFYEIKGPHNYVEIMDNMPFAYIPEEDWVWEMRDWYLNIENLDNPVIYDDGSKQMDKFVKIQKDGLKDVPDNPYIVASQKGKILSENVQREKIEFETTGIGQPHLVKVSYFPNWKVIGAEGPYLVSPSLMMVIPTQQKVTLYYGMTYANRIGVTLAVSGWAIIALVLIVNLVFYLKNKKKNKALR